MTPTTNFGALLEDSTSWPNRSSPYRRQSGIFCTPVSVEVDCNHNRSFSRSYSLLVIGFTIGSQDGDANETQDAPSTRATEIAPPTAATAADPSMDDWLEAVCAPGTYGASSNVLKNSITRPMSCRTPTRNGRAPIISIGTYDSNFLLKEDLHATNYGHVATATLTDGRIVIFALTRGVVSPEYFLNPLKEFGFDVRIGI